MKGKVGILYSPSYGAGWSSWGDSSMAMDQELAKAIEEEAEFSEIKRIAEKNYSGQYFGGLRDLCVEWVDEGTQFRIEEYDGAESILFNTGDIWQTATIK